MSCCEKSFTATGRLRRATFAEVAAWVVESQKGVKKSCILNGFKKAEIYPYDDNTVDSDVESSDDDEPLSNIDTRITPDLAELFHSDSKDEDFDGFTDDHEIHLVLRSINFHQYFLTLIL